MKKASRESGGKIWRDLSERLSCSRQQRTTVNVSRLNRYTEDGDIVVVPGKVLGAGRIEHPIHVAAFNFSEGARSKIIDANGKCMSILQLMNEKPKGSGVKIIG